MSMACAAVMLISVGHAATGSHGDVLGMWHWWLRWCCSRGPSASPSGPCFFLSLSFFPSTQCILQVVGEFHIIHMITLGSQSPPSPASHPCDHPLTKNNKNQVQFVLPYPFTEAWPNAQGPQTPRGSKRPEAPDAQGLQTPRGPK